jgi:hypothetical protein
MFSLGCVVKCGPYIVNELEESGIPKEKYL